MLYQTNWLDISYEANFLIPAFDLAKESVSVLNALYRHLAPRYTPRSSDMQVVGGSLLSDLKARITLFGGLGVLEVTADKFSASFTNAVGTDIETIKDCVAAALAAMAEWSPDLSYREESIRATVFLNIMDGADARDNFLNNLVGGKAAIQPEDFGATRVYPGMKVECVNLDDKWTVGFDVYRSWAIGEMLVANCNAIYQQGTPLTTFEEKAAHAGKMFTDFLAHVGLELQDTK